MRALVGRQLQGSTLGLNSLAYNRQCNESAAKPRTRDIVRCASSVRKANRSQERPREKAQSTPRAALGLSSAVHTIRELKHNLSTDLEQLWQSLPGPGELEPGFVELQATVVLCRREFFVMPVEMDGMQNWDLEDERSGKKVCLQLISNLADPNTGEAMRTSEVVIENWTEANSSTSSHIASTNLSKYEVNFKVKKDFGEPGALVVKNFHRNEFLLKEVTVKLPNHASVYFVCDSCVYNMDNYAADRVFFTNKVGLLPLLRL